MSPKSGKIPESHADLFDKKAFGSFTTLMSDGSPQTTPVWVDFIDGKVLVNSALGRQKDKNVRRDPRVAITLIDPDNPKCPIRKQAVPTALELNFSKNDLNDPLH